MAKRRRSRPVAPVAPTQTGARPQARPTRRATRGGSEGGLTPIRLGILAVVVVGVIAVGIAVLASGGAAGNYSCGQQVAAGGSPDDGQATADQGGDHVATGARLTYLFCPPASGPHYSEGGVAPARPGYYGPDSDIGPGRWVHNLEHGYVVALYRCGDGACPSDAEVGALRDFVSGAPQTATAQACGIRAKVIAARFEDMGARFALVAWNRVLLLDAFDADDAVDFATRWMEVEAPEATSC